MEQQSKAETTQPKRHHYIPITILENFTDEGGWLHIYRRQNPDVGIRPSRPDQCFLEGHLYSLINSDGTRDPKLEKSFAELEGSVGPLLTQVLAAARQDRYPDISSDQIEELMLYFYLQWKRVPDVQKAVTPDAEASAMMDRLLAELRQQLPDRSAEIDALDTPEARRRTLHNARVGSVTTIANDTNSVMRSRGFGVLRIGLPNKQFVIASRPILKLNPVGQSYLGDPIVEMWLPIAPDVAIGLCGRKGEKIFGKISDPAWVRAFNLGLIAQSTSFAGPTPKLIHSLATAR